MFMSYGFSVLCLAFGYLLCEIEKKKFREQVKFQIYANNNILEKLKDVEKKAKYWESKYNSLKLQTSVWILEKEEEIERLGELLNGTDNK